MRLDHYLVEQELFKSRARAQEAIKAGLVRVDGAVAKKASQAVTGHAAVTVDGDVHPFVSRGGVKLDAVLQAFGIDVAERACLDLGASTGGFTDVLLRRGARRVYAVDVGVGQLDPCLAIDPRVVNLEKTHAKVLRTEIISEPIEIVTCDVSFISLKKALPPALALTSRGAYLAALIKPQFEVGPAQIGKGGLVKPGRANAAGVAEDIVSWIGARPGWRALGVMDSPIEGGDGNREYLIAAMRT